MNYEEFIEGIKKRQEETQNMTSKPSSSIEEDENIYINSWVIVNSKGEVKDRNWGDDINFTFLPALFKKKVNVYKKSMRKKNYLMIGSILTNAFVDSGTVVWGSGILNNKFRLFRKPKEIRSVRGPLTREHILKSKIECPEIYGDPALLIPNVYDPDITKKYRIGLIPHHSQMDNKALDGILANDDVKLIKMEGYGKWTDVIDEIKSCDYIVSESLHGLIAAEAYGIPNLWAKVGLSGQDIKFHDFFLSLGKDRNMPFRIGSSTTKEDLLSELRKYEHVNELDLNPMIKACPFDIYLQ